MANGLREVRVMRGLPGSGKSTTAKKWEGATICSADDFHMVDGKYIWKPENAQKAHSWCLRKFLLALERRDDLVVVDNTNCAVWEMAAYCALALAFDYKLKVMTIPCEVDTAVARNVHKVPEETVRRMHKTLTEQTLLIPKHWNHGEIQFANGNK